MVAEISIVAFLFMFIIFLISVIRKDNGTADLGWCAGIMLISLFSFFQGGQYDLSKFIMNFFVLLWGFRLMFYMILRNRGRGEDFRYKKYRDSWKFFILRSFFQIYMLQTVVMLIVSFPVWFVNFSPDKGIDIFDIIGGIIFFTGFYFEYFGDHEMAKFRKDPANQGKIMKHGLWSVTRHPNYFGESLIWWGITFFAFNYPYGWITIICPAIMTVILRYVTGVPLMEKRLETRPGWEEYKNSTPVFFPLVKFRTKK